MAVIVRGISAIHYYTSDGAFSQIAEHSWQKEILGGEANSGLIISQEMPAGQNSAPEMDR